MKPVIILSGGLDSTTVLYYLMNKSLINNKDIVALSFNYGQKGKYELECAKLICELNNIKHEIINISSLVNCLSGSSLVNEEDNDFNHSECTVVPSRNTLLLELATAYAISNDCDSVYYGAINDDISDYPDTTKEFLEQINLLNKVNNLRYISVHAPLIDYDKEEVVKLAMNLGVPIDLTFSCYNPNDDGSPCGECISCLSRNEAIKKVVK